ncbi:hypothetical protein QYF36_010781 [Acer negundo]|nr:hypothetical protein QYF36_010781 [Acer negundo]
MVDLFSWLLVFFFIISLLAIIGYQLMSLTDLEVDYINPYDSAARINMLVMPEFVTQGILCIIFLVAGHWFMFLLSLPYLYFNMRLYQKRQHLLDLFVYSGYFGRSVKIISNHASVLQQSFPEDVHVGRCTAYWDSIREGSEFGDFANVINT